MGAHLGPRASVGVGCAPARRADAARQRVLCSSPTGSRAARRAAELAGVSDGVVDRLIDEALEPWCLPEPVAAPVRICQRPFCGGAPPCLRDTVAGALSATLIDGVTGSSRSQVCSGGAGEHGDRRPI